ncbi:MAG: ATP-dependent helicase, partial [Schwartzia succinivorans]|nr:ATP-dependent helicase [Schwartzia succinivorans]
DALQLVALRLLIKCKSSLRYWQKKYDYILVDEYQDVDENQAELLELLSASNGNVTVVGDQRQGIYSFRGSLSDSMEKFAVNAKQYELSINHRNNAAILGLGNQVMNMYTPLVSALYNAKVNYPLYALASNVTAEAKMITSEIKRLNKKGYKFSDIAILYRSGNLAIHIVDELIERNIPISMKSAVSSQYSKMPMRGLIDLFTYALLPCAKTFVAIKPILYLKHTAKTISSFDDVKKANIPFFQRDYIDSMASAIGKIKEKDLSPSKAAEVLLAAGYGKYLGESQKAAADSMVDALLEYDSIPQFLDHVRDVETQTAKIQQASGSTNDAVKLMTIHSSKGLEFKVVFIIGCYDGGLPSAHEGIDMHEERRLLYVAITRAKELLYISWPSLNEKNNEPNEASRFLREAFSMSKI